MSKIDVSHGSFVLVFLVKKIFHEKFFSIACKFRVKNDLQLTFDDSYICYASKTDVFQSSFVIVFNNGTTFIKGIFLSRTCTLRGKK